MKCTNIGPEMFLTLERTYASPTKVKLRNVTPKLKRSERGAGPGFWGNGYVELKGYKSK